jgi:hypothetical protein
VGQTKITGHCDGLMHKNGEDYVVDFACAKSRRLSICGKSSSFYITDRYASESVSLPWSTCGYGA